MIYVLSGGGSSTKLFAAIGVTYPAGSTCTCSNGTKTFTAKNTSGQWVFAIPETGTWTVTATDGTNSKSQSVSITTEGQFESVELSYQLVLFDNGEGVTWSAVSQPNYCSIGTTLEVLGNSPSTANHTMRIATAETIDFSKYSCLYFNVTAGGTNISRAIFGVCSTQNADADIVSANGSVGLITLDVSNINDERYVNMSQWGYGTTIAFTVNKVWLE